MATAIVDGPAGPIVSDVPTASVAEGSSNPDVDEKAKMLKATRQTEFYFADSNLPFDRFMWTLHTANPEHWVPVATVASFKRMREYLPLGIEWVAKALRLSEELEVDETNTKVRRRTEVQEPKNQFERSIYAKGFGKEEPDLQQKLEEFFEKYGKANAVRMRRSETKEFKGSVFVEFTDIKTVDAFLNADPKPSWNGEELLIMTKEAYCEMKIKEKGLTGKAAASRKETIGSRRAFNAFRDMEKGKGKGEEKPKVEIWLEFMGNKILVSHEDGGTIRDDDVIHVSGATLKFEGCGGQLHFADIKNPLRERFSKAPFVQYTAGEDHGLVGFDKALSEEDIAFVKETLKTLNSKDIEWSIPKYEDERAFQLERAKFAARQVLDSSQNGSSRGGRGGRGGRGSKNRGRGGGGRKGRDRETRDGKGKGRADGESQTGEKRKRAVEPDGGPDTGVRGKDAPPVIVNAKKVKVGSS